MKTLRPAIFSFLTAGLLLVTAAGPLLAQVQGAWTLTSNINAGRELSVQVTLKNGKVLIAGGTDGVNVLSSAEVLNTSTNKWTLTASMVEARESFPAVMLSNGKVLFSGGYGAGNTILAGAELYDPVAGTWSSAGVLSFARFYHTATLLKSGEVLVSGGCTTTDCSGLAALSELYNPATNTWTTTGSMGPPRSYHTATLLTNGKVLVVGGSNGHVVGTCELYDPVAGTWSNGPNTVYPRYSHAVSLLKDGKVLVTGGNPNRTASNSAELYDPTANTWTATGKLKQGRFAHTSTLLTNGAVVVAAGAAFFGCGRTSCFRPINTAETYDETTGTFTFTGGLNVARMSQTSSLMGNGRVLVVGGTG